MAQHAQARETFGSAAELAQTVGLLSLAARAQLLEGMSLGRMMRLEEALVQLRVASTALRVHEAPKVTQALGHMNLARTLRDSLLWDEAASEADWAAKLYLQCGVARGNVAATIVTSQCDFYRGRTWGAVDAMQGMLRTLSPEDRNAQHVTHNVLAAMMLELGDLERATDHCRASVAACPEGSALRFHALATQAVVCFATGPAEEADAAVERALAAPGAQLASHRRLQAWMLSEHALRSGDWEAVMALAEQAWVTESRCTPDGIQLWLLGGMAAAGAGDPVRLRRWLERAHIPPNGAHMLSVAEPLWSVLHRLEGDDGLARQALERQAKLVERMRPLPAARILALRALAGG